MSAQPHLSVGSDRPEEWRRLAELVRRAQASGLANLTEQELWDLPSLYRKALSDLSLLRTNQAAPHFAQELSQLCNAAHGVIYRGVVNRRRGGPFNYIVAELPAAVRRRALYIFACAALMLMFAVLGYVHSMVNPEIAEAVLSPRLVGGIHASLSVARVQSDLGLAAQIPVEQRMAAWVAITLNNIFVSIRAFLWGIAGGVLTIFIIAFNGYLLGVVTHLYFTVDPGIDINLPLYFISGIAPHGSIELPAICLAGGAGMLLGFSWVFPGQLTRGASLRAAAADAGKIALACVLTLVAAGIIEGFVTPLLPPAGVPDEAWFWFKIAVGTLVFLSWLAWLALGGRAREREVEYPSTAQSQGGLPAYL